MDCIAKYLISNVSARVLTNGNQVSDVAPGPIALVICNDATTVIIRIPGYSSITKSVRVIPNRCNCW